jgi:hypothetical protein
MMQKIDTFKQKKALKIFLKNLNISNNDYEIKSDSKFKIKKKDKLSILLGKRKKQMTYTIQKDKECSF